MERNHESRVTMLDPNIRPGFIQDPARHRARISRMAGMADIVKLSDEDLAWFSPDRSPDEAAPRWLDNRPEARHRDAGKDGAVAYSRSGKVSVPSQRVTVVDTVGAGDTFNAGVLAVLAERGCLEKEAVASLDASTIEAALTFGASVAAVTVSRAVPIRPGVRNCLTGFRPSGVRPRRTRDWHRAEGHD